MNLMNPSKVVLYSMCVVSHSCAPCTHMCSVLYTVCMHMLITIVLRPNMDDEV
jgi:hypothetical protein